MSFPLTSNQRWHCIAKETAKLSYPGSMSRGIKPVVMANTKKTVENYFTNTFPIHEILCLKCSKDYDKWHYSITKKLAYHIHGHVHKHNQSMSVAAKFLNTFMYQLCKYPEAQHLLPFLHLPLDARVFTSLKRMKPIALSQHKKLLKSSPYALNYRRHIRLQKLLLNFVSELNQRSQSQFKVRFRIELNWLWL